MKDLKNNNGYTLIELMVAISIFVTVVVTSTTILINILQEHNRTSNARALLDQARIFIDRVYIDVSNAQIDYFGINTDCLGSGSTKYPRAFQQRTSEQLLFIAEDGTCTGYILDNGQVKKVINADDPGSIGFIPMTDPSIQVNVLRFRLFEDGLETRQSQMDILIEFESLNNDGIPPYALQRTISIPQTTRNFETCSVGIGIGGIFCPFREEDFPTGSVVVDFIQFENDGSNCHNVSNNSCLHGGSTNEGRSRTQIVETYIAAGLYRVLVASYDNHIIDLPLTYNEEDQPAEQFHLYLHSTDEDDYEIKTQPTDDIGQQEDCKISTVEDAIDIEFSIEEVRGCHNAPTWSPVTECSSIPVDPGVAQSLFAVCAIFIPTT